MDRFIIDKGRALVFCLSESGMVRPIDSLDNRELLKTVDLSVATALPLPVICLTNSKGILRHSQYPMGPLVLKLLIFSNPICTLGLLIDRSCRHGLCCVTFPLGPNSCHVPRHRPRCCLHVVQLLFNVGLPICVCILAPYRMMCRWACWSSHHHHE